MQPHVEIVALGALHGNVRTAQTGENVLRIPVVVGRKNVPVAVGHPTPLDRPAVLAEAGGVGNWYGRPVNGRANSPCRRSRRRRTSHRRCYGVEPTLPALLRGIVCMGGASRVPANMSAWADANTWHAPEAGEEVLRTGFAMTMVPLDVTELRRGWTETGWTISPPRAPAARYASQVLDT
ncbi:nucleoside hydrolase [Streptomyces sp. x-80]|uniref:nucleoside hydrolase n=1 Tax=Streptomyces sp. x-80 TaxID=2789282 RepID=UPI0039816A5E